MIKESVTSPISEGSPQKPSYQLQQDKINASYYIEEVQFNVQIEV